MVKTQINKFLSPPFCMGLSRPPFGRLSSTKITLAPGSNTILSGTPVHPEHTHLRQYPPRFFTFSTSARSMSFSSGVKSFPPRIISLPAVRLDGFPLTAAMPPFRHFRDDVAYFLSRVAVQPIGIASKRSRPFGRGSSASVFWRFWRPHIPAHPRSLPTTSARGSAFPEAPDPPG